MTSPEEVREAILYAAIERAAASADGDAPDEDAQSEVDAILAQLEEPAFSELLAELDGENSSPKA
jgi:hypothetical protein